MKNFVEPIRKIEDINKIENSLSNNERDKLLFVFGINTGLRISDILGLNVIDVLNKDFVEIREKKTKKYKKFPLNKKLQNMLKTYLKNKDVDSPLFVGINGSRLHRSVVYRILNDVCREVGIKENIGTHTLRKTFGYHHYKKFNDVALLQKILNHSSPAITLRYIGITQDEIDYSYKNFEL